MTNLTANDIKNKTLRTAYKERYLVASAWVMVCLTALSMVLACMTYDQDIKPVLFMIAGVSCVTSYIAIVGFFKALESANSPGEHKG